MRLNTITFDANLPTTQQVNVPTNTDYKVGLKVKRNGEIQQLGPDEITIYTGEITPGDTTVVGPADSPSNLERTVNGTNKTTIFMMFPKVSLSAYTDKYIAPSDIEQTWHLSGETTATPLEYGNLEIGYGVQYVEGSTVWYSYQGKWCRIASGQIVEKKDRVQVTDTALMRQNFNLGVAAAEVFFDGTVPTAEAPILVDSTITFHDEDTPVTIPTDADKTNGYVTFTQASNDDANFRQLKVEVDTRVPGDKKVVDYIVQMTDNTIPRALSASVDEEGLVGQYYGEDGQVEMYLWNDASQPPEDYTQWTKVTPAGSGTKVVKCADGSLWYWRNLTEPAVIEGKTYDTGYWFLHTNTAGTAFVEGAKSVLLQTGDYLITGSYRYTANNWLGIVATVDIPPTGFKADFKLNVNEFKSQCGDLNAQTDPEFSTAKVEGTYEDGTEFSFDFCTK